MKLPLTLLGLLLTSTSGLISAMELAKLPASSPDYVAKFSHPGAYGVGSVVKRVDSFDDTITPSDYMFARNAYQYLVSVIAHQLLNGTADNLEQEITNLNACMVGQTSSSYRTRPVCVFHSTDEETTRIFQNIRNNGTQREKKTYEELLGLIDKFGGSVENALPYMSEQALAILRKALYLPILPDHVSTEMKELVSDMKQKIRDKVDAFGLASYVHMRLVQIHPFDNANGRTARALMNLVLMLAGKNPVVFFSDKNYTAAVRRADKEADCFADYLRAQEQKIHALVSKDWRGTMCEDCLKEPATLRCSQCKTVYYCSRDCQKNNWLEHKKSCQKR